jgi:ADP-ribose pyrophosphatase YjhB (NUDIX family)
MLNNVRHKKYTCNNCGVTGHVFYNCKRPIMSFGIVCYRIYNGNLQFLMIRRKDSLGYVELLRGKLNTNNDFHLSNIISEMTIEEINNIKQYSYSTLWDKLWNKKNEKVDKRNEEKFNHLKFKKQHLLDLFSQGWIEPEWGFPKGRRNNRENDFDCAIREFEEETGFSRNKLDIIKNMGYFEEVFTGSNMKSYKHKYYICKMNVQDSFARNFQKSEIGDMQWFTYEECMSKIRSYNVEKKIMLTNIYNIIQNSHELYSIM